MKGLQVNPCGPIIVTFKRSGDQYQITRCTTQVYNFIIGTMYVYHHGEMVCENLQTGERAVMELSKKGWTSSKDYVG